MPTIDESIALLFKDLTSPETKVVFDTASRAVDDPYRDERVVMDRYDPLPPTAGLVGR